MTGRQPPEDVRLNVARYQVDKLAREDGAAEAEAEDTTDNAGQTTMEHRAQFVEIAIRQAQRRGDFENLPGAGKPLQNLRETTDPDWWFRRKIERERITGLGPPALTLRTEDRELEARLDAAPSIDAVRELLHDFNTRVREAQRQLLGGPPVVTSPRDVDAEIVRWNERRAARYQAAEQERKQAEAERASRGWLARRRASRAATNDQPPRE
jgi:hypothetical protein